MPAALVELLSDPKLPGRVYELWTWLPMIEMEQGLLEAGGRLAGESTLQRTWTSSSSSVQAFLAYREAKNANPIASSNLIPAINCYGCTYTGLLGEGGS